MFRELIRKKQKLTMEECLQILKTEKRGVLSVNGDDGYRYGMPIDHFYNEEDGKIYFHTGNVGYRLEALRRSNKVSYCTFDEGYKEPGEWNLHIRSVIVFGTIEILDDVRGHEQIVDIATKLSHKFTNDEDYIQEEIQKDAHRTLLLALTPENICGKLVNEK